MGKVRDIMQKNVITIENNKSALDASRLLDKNEISFLVIEKDGDPIGIVTERDIVQKVAAEDIRASELSINEIMSKSFRWVKPDDDIEVAVQKMLNNNIRRLIVLDNERLVGAITQTDLASFLRNQLLINGALKNLESD